mgnify:CR=1 FL=1
MKSVNTLPEGYKELYSINLQKNIKTAFFVNLLAGIIAALLALSMSFAVPVTNLFAEEEVVIIKIVVLLIGMIVYMVLHEIVHGIAMKMCGTKKVRYGFTGLYAYAGSDDYYDKKAYIFIALAPVVFWGVVLLIINLLVPIGWFWVVYFIQIINLSGAAGDLFVTAKFLRLPNDVLVKDYGVSMTVYSKT